jgi:site-specific DNA recombinase
MENTTQKPRIGLAYLRVSSDQQAKSGLGISGQKEHIRNYAKSQGIRIKKYYCDAGISGAKGIDNRPALAQMLEDLSDGQVILCAKRDRLSRDAFLNMWIEKEAGKVNAQIESACGEGNGDNPASEMMRRIVDAFSQYERQLVSERTKIALKKAKERGTTLGKPPYGYKRDSIGRMVKNPDTYPIRERMVELYEDGNGWSAICHILNDEGVLSQTGKKWSPTVVMRILSKENLAKTQQAVLEEQEATNKELNEWEKE